MVRWWMEINRSLLRISSREFEFSLTFSFPSLSSSTAIAPFLSRTQC